jgi:hypothetical protein
MGTFLHFASLTETPRRRKPGAGLRSTRDLHSSAHVITPPADPTAIPAVLRHRRQGFVQTAVPRSLCRPGPRFVRAAADDPLRLRHESPRRDHRRRPRAASRSSESAATSCMRANSLPRRRAIEATCSTSTDAGARSRDSARTAGRAEWAASTARLARKDEVIADVTEKLVRTKKLLGSLDRALTGLLPDDRGRRDLHALRGDRAARALRVGVAAGPRLRAGGGTGILDRCR